MLQLSSFSHLSDGRTAGLTVRGLDQAQQSFYVSGPCNSNKPPSTADKDTRLWPPLPTTAIPCCFLLERLCGSGSASSGSSCKIAPSLSSATRTLILFCGYQKSQASSLYHHFPAWKMQTACLSFSTAGHWGSCSCMVLVKIWSTSFWLSLMLCSLLTSSCSIFTCLHRPSSCRQDTNFPALSSARGSGHSLHPQTQRLASSLGHIFWLEASDVPEIVAPVGPEDNHALWYTTTSDQHMDTVLSKSSVYPS